MNVFRTQKRIAATIRLLNSYIPTLEELNLPDQLYKLAQEPRGLILVTGPTGSGKSTTLASMIEYINQTKSTHIITIEDPIEYTYVGKKALIHQRETLHTTGAAQTIDRVIDACPGGSQNQIRTQLSSVIKGVITQCLMPTADGQGRIAGTEILMGTDAVCNLIRESKSHQMASVMQSGSALGMHTLNMDPMRLVSQRKITQQTAIQYTNDRRDLEQYF